jgi:hypothetical protein
VIDVPQEERSRYPGTATVVVSDLDELTRKLTAHGGQITVPESRSETGRFLYARHADGAEVEYVEWRPELVERVLGRPARPQACARGACVASRTSPT